MLRFSGSVLRGQIANEEIAMKKREMLIGAMLTLGCCGCSQVPPAGTNNAANNAKEVTEIKNLEDRFMAALKQKDVNGLMSCYVADESLFVFDVTPPRQYVGAAAYRKDWEDLLALFPGPIEADMTDVDITVGGGDIAWGHSIEHTVGSLKDGRKMDFTVRLTDGYRKVNSIFSLSEDSVMLQRHGLRPNTPVIFPLQTETKRPHYSFLFPYPLHLSIQYP